MLMVDDVVVDGDPGGVPDLGSPVQLVQVDVRHGGRVDERADPVTYLKLSLW